MSYFLRFVFLLTLSFCSVKTIAQDYFFFPSPPPIIINPIPPVDPYCGYGFSSVCHTFAGNTCVDLALYQPQLFSACVSLAPGVFTCSTGILGFPSFQRRCFLNRTPCVCSFTVFSYEYNAPVTVYEQGIVLP